MPSIDAYVDAWFSGSFPHQEWTLVKEQDKLQIVNFLAALASYVSHDTKLSVMFKGSTQQFHRVKRL